MRDKIVFFIFGALLATLAYLAGNMNNAKAQDRTIDGDIIIDGKLTVTGILSVSSGQVFIGNTLDSPENGVTIGVYDEQAQIGIGYGFQRDQLGFKQKSGLTLRADNNGARITLSGKYGQDTWFLSSNKPVE